MAADELSIVQAPLEETWRRRETDGRWNMLINMLDVELGPVASRGAREAGASSGSQSEGPAVG